jgi:SAM-dependent methyltransferase
MTDHVRKNRAFWDDDADAYQEAHGPALDDQPLAWGAFRVPEAELEILGRVAGKNVLELGCGAAQWSIALAGAGARVVGLDVSIVQLQHVWPPRVVPLVNADGERLPFATGTFDLVFCDHGAVSFCDPELVVPEVARVLRAGGRFAFCATHPLLYLTWNDDKERQGRRLRRTYEQLGLIDDGDGTIDWVLPPGRWFDLFARNGFVVERLVELLAPSDATTTYDEFFSTKWAKRWPAEWIWVARRSA